MCFGTTFHIWIFQNQICPYSTIYIHSSSCRYTFSLDSLLYSKKHALKAKRCFGESCRRTLEFKIENETSKVWDFLFVYFQRPEDLGGVISFPLLVPVKPTDRYVSDMRSARIFLKTQWKKPTLIMYSKSAFLPFSFGDFVVGNRRGFFEKLLPHAFVTPRIPGGHLIYYDNPKAVSNYITNFLK